MQFFFLVDFKIGKKASHTTLLSFRLTFRDFTISYEFTRCWNWWKKIYWYSNRIRYRDMETNFQPCVYMVKLAHKNVFGIYFINVWIEKKTCPLCIVLPCRYIPNTNNENVIVQTRCICYYCEWQTFFSIITSSLSP